MQKIFSNSSVRLPLCLMSFENKDICEQEFKQSKLFLLENKTNQLNIEI